MKKNVTEQVEENTLMLKVIERDIDTIKNNHLHHIEKDMNSINARIEKIDNRIWWVLGLLVASSVVGMLGEIL